MDVWEQGGQLQDRLKSDPEIARFLSASELDVLFDLRYHLKHVDTIFKRVFEE